MKISVTLSESEISDLDNLAASSNSTREQVIKDAISNYIAAMQSSDWIERGFGYWKD